MGTLFWITSGLLAVAFVIFGAMKAFSGKEKLASQMGWVEDYTDTQVRGIGGLEILGGLGVILPWITGIATWIAPVAAVCLALTMVGAAYTHYKRGEMQMVAMPAVLLVLSLFVAWQNVG